MKSATVRITGGLGNQMFGYAFAVALSQAYEFEILLDCESAFWKDGYKRICLLDYFETQRFKRQILPQSLIGRELFLARVIYGERLSNLLPRAFRIVVNEGRPARYDHKVLTTPYRFNSIFNSYWQSDKYFNSVASVVRQDLRPPVPTSEKILRIRDNIASSLSCSLHWRSYRETPNVASRPSLDGYYQEAIATVKAKYPGIRFIIFSDDAAAARDKFSNLSNQAQFIDLPESVGNTESLNDFYLMTQCDHAIIGFSSFSWWAAWLGKPEGKTVIAPTGLNSWGDDWIPESWINIPVH